jgi:hypothetical protein
MAGGMTASFRISCTGAAGQTCAGTATETTTEHLGASGNKISAVTATNRKKPRTKKVVVGQQSYTVAAGQTVKVTVALNGTGTKLLNRFQRLPVTLTITTVSAGKSATLNTRGLTFKKSTKHKKR